MIELKRDNLLFTFPEVHPNANLSINFQRTLRIPDDDKNYPLPPGLGSFPVRHVDNFTEKVPEQWIERGGVMFPMRQSEAMWITFRSVQGTTEKGSLDGEYPFAVKVATGKINAVTGEPWENSLHKNPQDYLVVPDQPWLDGYCVEKGIIRQFVAMPLGSGYTAEEQITGEAEHGGLQIIVYPMKADKYEKLMSERSSYRLSLEEPLEDVSPSISYCVNFDMGLAPGGKMQQEIYEDEYEQYSWDLKHSSRCFVHINNSHAWQSITGEEPPGIPLTAKEYSENGMPWFDYYDEKSSSLGGSKKLSHLKSITEKAKEKRDDPLPENESANPKHVIKIRKGLKKNQVREGSF